MMKNLLVIIFLSCWLHGVDYSQQNSAGKMIFRAEGDIRYDYLQEVSLNFSNYVDKNGAAQKPEVALRLCSNDPIQLAVLKSAIYLPAVFDVFAAYPKEDIILIKSDNCLSKRKFIAPLEVWAVLPGDSLPPHNENYSSNQIKIKTISNSVTRYTGNSNYLQNARKLIKELKANSSAFGSVFGVYIAHPNEVTEKIRRVHYLLEKNKIPTSQYHIEMLRWSQFLSLKPSKGQAKYPSFFVVNIQK